MQRRWSAFPFFFTLVALSFIQAEGLAIETFPDAAAEDAAQKGLEIFDQLITKKNAGAMGFKSFDEVPKKKLGKPMRIVLVRLKQLEQYQPNHDLEKMLVDMHRFIYPVTVGKEVRSSLTVAEIKGKKGWKATEFGSPKQITLLSKYRTAESDFVVRVPRLHLYFIGARRDGAITLTPIVNLRKYKFIAGEPLPAHKVFIGLKQKIKEQTAGSPRGS